MTASRDELIETVFRSVSTVLMDVEAAAPAGLERLLVLSNATGVMQLYELADGNLRQITALEEPVTRALYLPGSRRAVLSSDIGGNERDQLYLVSLDGADGEPEALTADPDHGHHLAGVSPDGRLVAYTSNRGNDVDYDVWVVDLEAGAHRLVWAGGGYCAAAGGFSPDGRWLAVNRVSDRRPLDGQLFLVDVQSGELREPLPHGEEAVAFGVLQWLSPASFWVSSNAGRDFAAIVRHDLESAETVTVAGTGVDADAIQMLGDPALGDSVLLENRDCATPLWRWSAAAGRGVRIPWPEPGVCTNWATPPPQLSSDGRRLYFTHMSLRLAPAVYRHDLGAGVTTRLTPDPLPVDPSALPEPEIHTIASFDGEPIQFYLLDLALGPIPSPVVVLLHGGPALQSQLRFDPVKQALVAAGYAVVVPNVRGSTGYGRRFAALDDVGRRLDAVADLAAVHAVLGDLGLDDSRAALWGESYGGYMVLAGLSMQPDLWAAGVEIVGIANLVTYLENTAPYRRAMREVEYGSLERDRELLAQMSPLTYVDQIRAPLFVVHGRNDPRVPVSESVALHAELMRRGVPCELTIYENEGHGIARLENRLDGYPRAIRFLDDHLRL